MHAISASIWKMRNANWLILQIVCDKRTEKKSYHQRSQNIAKEEILISMKFWEAKDCIFDIWRQSQSHDCRCEKFRFCSYLALICLSKNLWGDNFYKKEFNCRQLLAPVVGLAEEEAEVGVCEVGSTLLDRACDLSLWFVVVLFRSFWLWLC